MQAGFQRALGNWKSSNREGANMLSKTQTWTFISDFYEPHIRRVTLQLDIEKCNYTTIIIEPHPSSGGDEFLENRLVKLHADGLDTEAAVQERNKITEQITSLCRTKYGRSAPPFGSVVYAFTANGKFQVVDLPDHRLTPALKTAPETFGTDIPLPPLVPRAQLKPVAGIGQFLLSQTRLVEYQGKLHIAKGPIYPQRAMLDLGEVKNLISLPGRHPNLLDPPAALITLSETDERVCGFLTTYHANGNLEFYARKLRKEGKLTPKLLVKWALQLVDAVSFLTRHQSFHGDLKPDNIVVTENEDIVLIDFTRLFTTFVTASPEVRKLCTQSGGTTLGIPVHWPMESIIQSEVYSIGRTLYLVCEGVEMAKVYREMGWTQDGAFLTVFSAKSSAPPELQKIISLCVSQDPSQRPSLEALAKMLRAADKKLNSKGKKIMTRNWSFRRRTDEAVVSRAFYMIRSRLLY